jgi:hypothetical protein
MFGFWLKALLKEKRRNFKKIDLRKFVTILKANLLETRPINTKEKLNTNVNNIMEAIYRIVEALTLIIRLYTYSKTDFDKETKAAIKALKKTERKKS